LYRFFMDPDMDVYPERGCVAEWHGTNVFLRDGDEVPHILTCSPTWEPLRRERAGQCPAASRLRAARA
jgi:hypothetical protein